LPIVLYGSKSMILEATMKSGVYKIRNVVTDRVYIGSSVDMESRMKLSPETRKKISESNKGKPSSRKGVKMSEETKRKISETERRTKNLKKEVQKSVPTGR
jgi:hypothetical protein